MNWRGTSSTIWSVVGTLLLAACLRIYRLTAIGLEHDEVANWLIDRAILDGNHSIYFAEAYGHEAGFHYIQALFVALLGDHSFALRLPAALLGVLVVAVSYRLVKALYHHPIALIAALIVAVTFFPIFYSRLALRAMMLPIFSGLSGYFFWKSIRSEQDIHQTDAIIPYSARTYPLAFRNNNWYLTAAAIFAGLSTYTYMASRVVPIFYGLFFVCWFVFSPMSLRMLPWGKFGRFFLTYTIIAAPLYLYLRLNPGSEFRISEINQPLEALLAGDVGPVLANARQIVGVWGWSGDPLWRQNVATAAIFNPLTALLFYAGLAVMLWRWRWADLFVLLWLATATIPSLVTADAPSTIRMINMLPVLGVPIATFIHTLSTLSTKKWELSTTNFRNSWITCLTILALLGSMRSFHYLHTVWPENSEVQFVWQQSLTNAGRWLDDAAPLPATILGWSADTMDPPTMALTMQRDDVPLRFSGFDDGVAAIVPGFGDGDVVRVIRPKTPPINLHPSLAAWLEATPTLELPDFSAYQVSTGDLPYTNHPEPILFSNELRLTNTPSCQPGADPCTFLTAWQLDTPSGDPRSIFIHAIDADGNILAQSDVLLPAPTTWKPGDHILVGHTLPQTDAMALRIGVYNPQNGVRLPTSFTTDHIAFPISTDR